MPNIRYLYRVGMPYSMDSHLANQQADGLAKRVAKRLVSFVGDYMPP